MVNILTVLAVSALSLAAPLILAALGGLMSERSGIINISLEGKMLMAACLTAIVGSGMHSAFLGLLAGIFAAILLSCVHWLMTQKYHVDHVISGMAINLFALGATNFLDKRFQSVTGGNDMPHIPRFLVHVGNQSIQISLYMIAAYMLPPVILWGLRSTRFGLHLLAVGNDPSKAAMARVNTMRVRLFALIWTGTFAGLAGVLIADNAGRFTDNMTAGRGYIALAALIIGQWRPITTAIACLVFGFFEALQIALQGVKLFGVEWPPQFWQALPYVAAIIAVAGLISRGKPPHALGKT